MKRHNAQHPHALDSPLASEFSDAAVDTREPAEILSAPGSVEALFFFRLAVKLLTLNAFAEHLKPDDATLWPLSARVSDIEA